MNKTGKCDNRGNLNQKYNAAGSFLFIYPSPKSFDWSTKSEVQTTQHMKLERVYERNGALERSIVEYSCYKKGKR